MNTTFVIEKNTKASLLPKRYQRFSRNGCLKLITMFLVLSTMLGCGSGDVADKMFAEANDMNIKRVSSLYAVYQAQHKFKGPKDEAELKSFVSQQNEKQLARIGVDPANLDELFISERDNQPFKIRWELVAKPRQGPVPIVFEQTGVDGKFMVAFSSYICREVEKVEYDELWAGKRDEEIPDANRGGTRR